MPYTQSWTVGWQRKLGQDTAFEARYVGSRHRQDWETQNINEISITDNGFVQEFRKAQANLQANIAAGRGATFAYTGAAGTSPLPTFLAFFQGLPSGQAGNTANYTSTQFTNATNLGFLAAQNPNPFGFASVNSTSGFVGNAGFRTNGINAGLPANFFLANPDVLGGTANNSPAEPDDQLRRHARQLDAVRVPQAALERPDVQHQLRLGERVDDAALRLPARRRRNRAGRPGRQRAARGQGQLALRAAVRRGQAAGAATRAA